MWTVNCFLVQLLLMGVAQGLHHQNHFRTRTVMCKPRVLGSNSNNNDEQEKDALLAKIAAKEAEFQAELDKLLLEARTNSDSNKEVEGFNDKDLAKAIAEMQKLNKNKQQKQTSSISDKEITKFIEKMQQQVTLTNKQQQAITDDADSESSFIRVVVPPGNNNLMHRQETYLLSSYPIPSHLILTCLLCVCSYYGNGRGASWGNHGGAAAQRHV